jgi:predicted nucleic acid-binding protein
VELADTSAWIWSRRADHPDLRHAFDELLHQDLVATCDMVRLELLYSARNGAEFGELHDDLGVLLDCPVGPREWRRAIDVYGMLAASGGAHQRSVKHPDLLIAAAAESAGIALVHYDEDYERIAAVTRQPHRWLAPLGSLR